MVMRVPFRIVQRSFRKPQLIRHGGRKYYATSPYHKRDVPSIKRRYKYEGVRVRTKAINKKYRLVYTRYPKKRIINVI